MEHNINTLTCIHTLNIKFDQFGNDLNLYEAIPSTNTYQKTTAAGFSLMRPSNMPDSLNTYVKNKIADTFDITFSDKENVYVRHIPEAPSNPVKFNTAITIECTEENAATIIGKCRSRLKEDVNVISIPKNIILEQTTGRKI